MAMELASRTEDSRDAPLHGKSIVWMVLLVTAATYLGTIRFGFVYDDDPQILNNPFVKAWHYVPQYFFNTVWGQIVPSTFGNYYRPAFLLLMRTGYARFGTHALGWHLLSITMHLLVTWLTYVMVRKMTGQFTIAWLAALIFGVHPVHHEVVAWISGTTESLFAIFFLLAFLAYLQSREGSKILWMTVSCVLYALALLSKETAIVLPALVFTHAWIGYDLAEIEGRLLSARRLRSAFAPAVLFLPIALLYLLARNKVLSGLGHSIVPISPLTWLLTLPSILLFYVRNWFFPFRLSEFYDLFYQPKLSVAHVLLPLAVPFALALVLWILRNRLGTKPVGYAVAWIVIPLLPALDTFVFKPDELVHDRYLYLPSVGAALLVALLIDRALRSRRVIFGQPIHVVVTGLALATFLASFAGYAASFWRSDYALFLRADQIAPLNSTAMNDLAVEMIGRHEMDGAQKLLEMGYRNNPGDYHFQLNLGRMYYRRGDFRKAESFLLQVRELEPNLPDAYILMGQIQLKQDRPKEAQESMRQAVQLNPYSAPTHAIYGAVLALNGDCTDADQQFQAALTLNPGDTLTQVQMNRCNVVLSPATHSATNPGQL